MINWQLCYYLIEAPPNQRPSPPSDPIKISAVTTNKPHPNPLSESIWMLQTVHNISFIYYFMHLLIEVLFWWTRPAWWSGLIIRILSRRIVRELSLTLCPGFHHSNNHVQVVKMLSWLDKESVCVGSTYSLQPLTNKNIWSEIESVRGVIRWNDASFYFNNHLFTTSPSPSPLSPDSSLYVWLRDYLQVITFSHQVRVSTKPWLLCKTRRCEEKTFVCRWYSADTTSSSPGSQQINNLLTSNSNKHNKLIRNPC